MARQTTVRFVDDLDGGEAEGTVTFALDGKAYEIDLSAANREGLEKALEPFIAAARRGGGVATRTRRSSGSRPTGGNATNAAIRKWAAEHGMAVSERGRISKTVLDAYLLEHGSPAA
jgi:hypothetical protein